MEQFVIEGEKPLYGTVRIHGAKNAALPILAATLLSGGIHEIHDVPRLKDIEVMGRILGALGSRFSRTGTRIQVDASTLRTCHIPDVLMRRMRSSIFLMGPLLSRLGEVSVTRPGGCAIGSRPIDLHLYGLQSLGAHIEEKDGLIRCSARKLTGTTIHFKTPSVGATENVMLAAVRAEGTTVIRNAAREPEIVDLQAFLNRMGADVRGAGTDTIVIRGVRELRPASHEIIPDRIVAGTLAVAAAAAGGEVTLTNTIPDHLRCTLNLLKRAGVSVSSEGDAIRVRSEGRHRAVGRIETQPYPGFPTDMQPQMMAFLCLAEGTSVICERIFDARLKHVGELVRMGADLTVDGNTVWIRGVPHLTGADVEATDLRAGAALVVAGLAARGITRVGGVQHIDRGYEGLEEILRSLGGRIYRNSPSDSD